jgi:RNA recognition motif-containing protein
MDRSNLIVNYLQSNVTEEDLNALFCAHGLIQSLKIVRDKATGISMGFGFVNFETNEAANRAAEHLNGLELNGKRIKVSVARPAWKANIHSNLYIANLPSGSTENDVLSLVGPELATHIEHVRMLKNSATEPTTVAAGSGGIANEFKGVAVARFDTEENACMALEILCAMPVESPISGTRMQIHAKPWRPEFRPERAAAGTGAPNPRQVAPTLNRRKLSIDDLPPLDCWTSSTASTTTLRANVKPFVPTGGRLPPPPPMAFRPMAPPPPAAPRGGMPITEQEEAILSQSFEQFGAFPGVSMYGDRSWGYVRFPTMHAAMAAVKNLTGFNVNGKLLELEAAV